MTNRGFLLLGISAFCLAACGDGQSKKAKTDSEMKNSSIEGGSTLFAETMEHVDFGGPVFGYMEVKGDLEKLASTLQKAIDGSEELMSQLPPGVDVDLPKVLGALGFGGIEAMAMSSVKWGERYLNKAFVKMSGPRRGIPTLLGGDAQPFRAVELVPKDADLVIEREFKMSGLLPSVKEIVAMGGPEMAQQLEGAIRQPLPVGGTIEEVLSKADGRVLAFARLDPEVQIPLPNQPSVKLPAMDVVVVVEGLNWLFDPIVGQLPPQMQQIIEGEKGSRVLQFPPIGPDVFERIQPGVFEDAENNRIVFTSSPAYWKECLAGTPRLSEHLDFKAVMEGLPDSGNGMVFISRRLKGELTKLRGTALDEGVEKGELQPGMADMLSKWMDPEPGPEAAVQVNLPDGIYFVSNSTVSMKETAVLLPLAGAGVFAAMTFPIMKMTTDNASLIQDQQNCSMIYKGIVMWSVENNGAYPEKLEELDGEFIDFNDSLAAYTYFPGNSPESSVDSIIVAGPNIYRGNRAVVYADGRVEDIPEEQFQQYKRDN